MKESSNSSAVEQIDLNSLVCHHESVAANDTLETVSARFQGEERNYKAVLDGKIPIGLFSRGKLGVILGSRFGFSLHGKTPVRGHMLEEWLCLRSDTPLREVLDRALLRTGPSFYDDIVLTNTVGEFAGIISVQTLAKVQSDLVAEKFALLEAQDRELRLRNEALTDVTVRLNEANGHLAIARDSALESARLKSEFLANMSHEIRTPMNGILGMTAFLLDTRLSSEQREYAEVVRSSADSLLTIINDILDFSKIEAGKLEIDAVDFDVVEVLESAGQLLASRAEAKNLWLHMFVDHDLPGLLHGDPGRIRQVLNNLVGNAVKFTESGEVMLRAELEAQTEETVTVRFEVKDTGIGIPSNVQGRMFQAFMQADGSTTRKYGGTGLGLAISKQLVELMGGTIGMESESGKGSLFWFRVPFRRTRAISLRPEADLRGRRILLVSSNTNRQEILLNYSKGWSASSILARNGREALSTLREGVTKQEAVELVVFDAELEDMTGFDLAELIRAIPELGSAKLVLMASLQARPGRERLDAAGISLCLAGPLKRDRMAVALTNILQGTRNTEIFRANDRASSIAPHSDLRVLLAEDNRVNQRVAILTLNKLGFKADIAETGRQAVKALQEKIYDVVLMDCQMPDLDGYEATKQIRTEFPEVSAQGTTRSVYIVAVTANALEGDRMRCLDAGMNDYLSKPFSRDALRVVLEKVAGSIIPETTIAAAG